MDVHQSELELIATEIDGSLEQENRPELQTISGLEDKSDPSQLGPMSLVLLVLLAAGQGVLPLEQQKIQATRHATMGESTRLIPVASEPARTNAR